MSCCLHHYGTIRNLACISLESRLLSPHGDFRAARTPHVLETTTHFPPAAETFARLGRLTLLILTCSARTLAAVETRTKLMRVELRAARC